jgi:sulfatase maturation enzyme AslB (radical SAM superfamily)
MHVKPNKDVHLCSRKSIPLDNLNNATPEGIFNSSTMNSVRTKMLNGECVAGCEKCYHEEKVNKGQSLRTFMNNWFDQLLNHNNVLPWKEGFLDRAINLDTNWEDVFAHTTPSIKWVALHASNVCNLACRGCYSLLSTKWRKDEEQLGINPYPLQNAKLHEFGFNFDDIDFVTMYGGEPFYMKQNNELTNTIESDPNIKNKILQYFTNGMILPSAQTFAIWRRIRQLQLIISIDSYDTENDYFRHGSKWSVLEKNLQLYIKESLNYNYELRISTLINIYNVNNLDVLHNWLVGQGIPEKNIDYNLCIYPQELDIRNLPQDYKDKVMSNYTNISLPDDLTNMILEHIQLEPNIDFIAAGAFSNKLDEIRNQTNPIPELKLYMDNS